MKNDRYNNRNDRMDRRPDNRSSQAEIPDIYRKDSRNIDIDDLEYSRSSGKSGKSGTSGSSRNSGKSGSSGSSRSSRSSGNGKNNKKKGVRLDIFIGRVTILTIIVFAIMIYCDYKGIGKSRNTKTQIAAAETTVAPATTATVSATKGVYKANNKIVCIDPGHGGTDAGAESGGSVEKDQTLAVATLVKQYLEAENIKVVMTRTTDAAVTAEKRVETAEAANAGILVSIHRNYYEGASSAKGAEAWIHTSSPSGAKLLANDILTQLVKTNGITNRGLKTGTIANANTNYAINQSKCTSCILELGFITNSSDNTFVTTNKSQCAKAIAQGIINYINEVEK